MKRRFMALVLAAALTAGVLPAAYAAAEDVPETEKALVLAELEIMVGDQFGDLRLEEKVNRAQFAKLAVAASAGKDSVGDSIATDPYPDVPRSHWAAPWVKAAVSAGLVKGDLTGHFHPDNAITLQEGVTMVLRLLGYQDSDFDEGWPAGQMAMYRALELDAGVTAGAGTEELTRRDALHLFYNLLTAPNKMGTPYINTLGHTLNREGEVDLEALLELEREGPVLVTGDWTAYLPYDPAEAIIYRDGERAELADLEEWDTVYWAEEVPMLWAAADNGNVMAGANAAMEGPVVVTEGWEEKLPFAPGDAASVTRGGKTAVAADIQENDVVYWNEYTKSLYVYCDKVAGTVDAVSPTLSAPTAVTVAGKSYPLETSAAIYAFSDFGAMKKGNTVTLLLGRGGGVAAVRAGAEAGVELAGVVTAVGSSTFTDDEGESYSDATVTITATDGTSYTYRWAEGNVAVGDVARVEVGPDGALMVARLYTQQTSGRVADDLSTLGGNPLSPTVEILDTCNGRVLRVWPERLAGVWLTKEQVRWYSLNGAGEIDRLILDDVTGDLHGYGILTDISQVSVGMYSYTTYSYDIGGAAGSQSVMNKTFPVAEGPVALVMDSQEIEKLSMLTEVADVTVSGTVVRSATAAYTLADGAPVYILEDGVYTLSVLSRVNGGDYTINAYYDRPQREGGRVRLLVAEKE